MKIKSLLLGSIAAAGLSTGAYAADLNVLTSLDVCDALGISGLTISSDTNCLQITGEVKWKFEYGNNDGVMNNIAAGHDSVKVNSANWAGTVDKNMDWLSEVDAYLKFVGTADSDFGPASATLKFDYDNDYTVVNEAITKASTDKLRLEEAYVSVGDSTVIMAGQKGSIFKNGDDVGLTWLELYNSEGVDHGVDTPVTDLLDGGPSASLQVVSDLGNGVSVGAGLENLNGALTTASTAEDGVFVGYVAYAGDGISAHVSVAGGGFLDGTIEDWGMHAGITGEFDAVKFVAAFAADDNGYWNALASASYTFDMFTLAAGVEAVRTAAAVNQWGASVSGSAEVVDGITINAGFRWFDEDSSVANTESWQAAAALVAAVTETVTITGELGVHGTNKAVPVQTVPYGSVELAWVPGGDFTSSVKGEINSVGAYKVTYKAAKSFK